MALTINTNMSSMNAQRTLSASQSSLQQTISRLSSGLRVNSAADDAAGLGIATRMDSQTRGMSVAIRNANDAISFAQTADGGLASMNSSLQRMRELAVQASNGTYTSTDRTSLQSEFSQLQKEVTRVSSATKFNGISVLASTSDVTFQVGADNTSTTDQISISAVTASTDASITAATGTGTAISSQSAAQSAITAIDSAISQVNTFRANVGASQNRFESVIQNLQVFNQNQSAAKSRIVDADFSEETTKMTRNQILMQAGTAMLAQANQLPQSVLKLLQ